MENGCQDITRLKADVIVDAADSQTPGCFIPCHACIDNVIHSAAGQPLRDECTELMQVQGCEESVGRAKIIRGYNLPAKFVLHTVGPIIGGRLTERDCEAGCCRSCFKLAAENRLESVAFCRISAGEFHFPNEKAAQIVANTVREFMRKKQA